MKALFFDIDNTLIPKGQDEIIASSLQGILEAKKKGLKIIVATGRCFSAMQKDIKEKVLADYYITCNGPCINNSKGNVIKGWPISEEYIQKTIDYFVSRDIPFGFKCDNAFTIYHKYDEFCDLYCSGSITKKMLLDNTKDKDYHKKHQLFSCFYQTRKENILDLIKDTPLLNYVNALAGGESFLASANKGNAVKEVAKILNIDLKDCMAFGDADNDIEMLKMSGIGICMGNGTENAKGACDYVTDDIYQDGIYHALKHFEVI